MANHSGIIDSGVHFEIVPNTRQVVVPSAYNVIGTVGDHLSEQLTFKCPKLIDGHDIERCARHYVTWKNVNQEIGHDELELSDTDEEYLYFTWEIRDNLAIASGLVSFSVHFEDVSEDGKTKTYRWSTTTCSECEILESINGVLGAYEAMYVVGDTFVIEDYTPIHDETLTFETNGIVPDGTLNIQQYGTFDVARYAQVNVIPPPTDAISISVSEDGTVAATANDQGTTHKLSSQDDTDFIPENIARGTTIFGVTGTYEGDIEPNTTTNVVLHNLTGYQPFVIYTGLDGNLKPQICEVMMNIEGAYSLYVLRDTPITVYLRNNEYISVNDPLRITGDVCEIALESKTTYVLKPLYDKAIFNTLHIGLDNAYAG